VDSSFTIIAFSCKKDYSSPPNAESEFVNVYGAQESIPGLLKSIKILSQLPPITEIPNHIQYIIYPTRLDLILIVDEIYPSCG
jgi:hypothetical protein